LVTCVPTCKQNPLLHYITTIPAGQQQQVKMVLVVAVALIDSQHRLLLAQRPPGKAMAGLWEFPGGKASAFSFI
jgi:8-oxo-dGTP diphosphatase